ncbi:hypothetical protein ACFOKF_06675 [Sphingobium rhizovicinum]|uniref:Lipoprotein n=1 Tax=Sphingobium rhizovicinum TaxID=432308 RepID=A0ABV7NBL9_9SPHN
MAGMKLASLSALTLLSACARPVADPAKLEAIRNEAQSLAKGHPVPTGQTGADIPKNQWPPTITSLAPTSVMVNDKATYIQIRQGFDGGWGYEIPRDGHSLTMPIPCYSEPIKGLFWHGPC